jgi:hypothetical protein
MGKQVHQPAAGRLLAAMILAAICLLLPRPARAADDARKLSFEGVLSESRLTLQDLADLSGGKDFPADWSGYTHLVMEMRTATPQRFGIWVYTADGPRRIEFQPLGQNAWFRASVPLAYWQAQVSGNDLAASTNRRSASFWISVWGPWGELKDVQSIGFTMDYPINHPVVELRNVHLAKTDEGSKFLETGPGGQMVDQFGQWALADWPRKIHSAQQLAAELADEAANFAKPADFGYGRYYGYAATQAKATGFFRVEQVDGKWWFVDPDGHLFLATGVNGTPGGFGGRRGGAATLPAGAANLVNRRLDSWGMTTGGTGRPNISFLRFQLGRTWLGLPDVYSDEFAAAIDAAANQQCTPRKLDPLLIGYFVGNEPPWGGRESEVCNQILAGATTATQAKLKDFLAAGDTPKRRTEFVVAAFGKYLEMVCGDVRKYDPNHLIVGIRFGGNPSEAVLRLAKIFDVCSINVYEYEPTLQIARTNRFSGRPVMVGEFHIGVPENGMGAGLVQAMNQTERGNAYRYFVEQGASLNSFVGEWWFQWRDEPVLGRMDGENYSIGFVDAADRAYPELVEAARATNMRLFDVHSGKAPPFSQRPKASDLGTPASPWDLDIFHGG